jgi:hypothetical protein
VVLFISSYNFIPRLDYSHSLGTSYMEWFFTIFIVTLNTSPIFFSTKITLCAADPDRLYSDIDAIRVAHLFKNFVFTCQLQLEMVFVDRVLNKLTSVFDLLLPTISIINLLVFETYLLEPINANYVVPLSSLYLNYGTFLIGTKLTLNL